MPPSLNAQLEVLMSRFQMSEDNQHHLKDTLEELKDAIYIGNEKNTSIIFRLLKLDNVVEGLIKLLAETITRISHLENQQLELQKEERIGRWRLTVVMAVSIIWWLGVITTKTNVMTSIFDWIK